MEAVTEDNMKPVPIPRNKDTHNNNTGDVNANGSGTVKNSKPIPLPRKLLQRLSSGDKSKKHKDKDVTNQHVPIVDPLLSDESKRGTINIFKRGRSIDPFEEFEKDFQEPHPLRTVSFSSPIPPELSEEIKASFPSMSSSLNCSDSDSSDYYNQPVTNKPVLQQSIYEPIVVPKKPQRRLIATVLPVPSSDNLPPTDNQSSDAKILQTLTSTNFKLKKQSNLSTTSLYENETIRLTSISSTSSPSIPSSIGSGADYAVPIKKKGGKNFYEINSVNSTLLTDDFCHQLSSGCSSRTTSLPSADRSNSKSAKDRSNCLSEGSSTSLSPRKKPVKGNTYDDVTLEDGTVVFLDNQLNTKSKTNVTILKQFSTFTTSQNSIVMEFDPLFEARQDHEPDHRNSSSLSMDENGGGGEGDCGGVGGGREGEVGIGRGGGYEGAEDVGGSHSYEAVSSDDEKSNVAKRINIPTNLDLNHCIENPNYIPLTLTSDSVQKIQKDGVRPALSPVEENYEEVTPPPPLVSHSQSVAPSRNDAATLDDAESTTDDGITTTVAVNLKRAEGGGSFLRRLSHKIRLIPIREESLGGSRKSSLDNLTPQRCDKCQSEHGENGVCKFTPPVRSSIVFSSYLYKPSGIVQKDFTKRWVVLSNAKLSVYNDKKVVIEEISLEKGTLITKKGDNKLASVNGVQLKQFEITFGGKNSLLLAAASDAERASWMVKWAEMFVPPVPAHVVSAYDRAGWCYIKETVTSEWYPSWLILKDRCLIHGFTGADDYFELDLRKARSVVLSTKDSEQKCPFVDNSEVLTVDMISKILFIQTDVVKVTGGWEKVIKEAATQNGAHFNEMQLTVDEIPVIVDKCIDFLYAHGTLAEGIYRQSGSNTRISQLLSDFQKDSWSVQISHKEFSAHDVAGTLKRFFRTLPDPLFTAGLYSSWIATSRIANEDLKMKTYEDLLHSLPPINKNILKKLICHLYAVHELHEKNLMPLNNLAPIWGPTLMNVETPMKMAQSSSESDDQYKTACAESEVVKDLIRNYYVLFRVDIIARERERKMQDALENFHLGATKRKCSGDMKIWIYIWEKDESAAINITLTPQGTAHTIVQQLCRLAQLRNHENLSIHEVICGNSLERPLHPSEIVIETVLRWSIWDIDERKNNYLILKKNTLYPALIPYAKDPTAVYGDFKFADSKSKSFKKYAFKFGRAMLKYYKHSKATTELGSWKIEDIVWYMGTESKRSPTPKWAFTFVKRNYPFKRSREEPYFGNVVSCSSEEDLYKWIAAMVIGEHPAGLYPSVIV